ncbi:MAG TPA: hypothetical protein VFR58_04380 [Flavisolibacter sp.]|nr:hypothetical protein [Flavisolibacter sp.]
MRYVLLLLLSGLAACVQPRNEAGPSMMGYAPVYLTGQTSNNIGMSAARATKYPGKIYAYQQWLFQVEQYRGIHIIDNSNPQQAHKMGFLEIPSCTEIAIKANHLYTNNLDDLVVFDISNIGAPQLVKRLDGAFPQFSQEYPPVPSAYFECPDPSKGLVIAWEEKLLDNAKCRR